MDTRELVGVFREKYPPPNTRGGGRGGGGMIILRSPAVRIPIASTTEFTGGINATGRIITATTYWWYCDGIEVQVEYWIEIISPAKTNYSYHHHQDQYHYRYCRHESL